MCVEMNQHYNLIIILNMYNVLFNIFQTTIYVDQYLSQHYTTNDHLIFMLTTNFTYIST